MSSGLDLTIPVDDDWWAEAVLTSDDAAVTLADGHAGTEVTIRGGPDLLRRLLTGALASLDGKASADQATGATRDLEGWGTPDSLKPGMLVQLDRHPPYRPFLRSLVCEFHDDCRLVAVRMPSGGFATAHMPPGHPIRWISPEHGRELTAEAIEAERGAA